MPETSELEPPTHTIASSADQNGDYPERGAEADMDRLSSDKNTVNGDHLEDVEKGSPPNHPPHVVKDEGVTAWGTTLGAYVERNGQKL